MIKPVLGIGILTNFNDFTEIVYWNENTNNGTNPYITALAFAIPFSYLSESINLSRWSEPNCHV